ncbi:D-amino-acid transaminase, chloroplastic-like isoform X2 [Oryza brachyantha]|uniref:D-amino-acid transaminase, chloroplastic-like isoform X2 n=1 Tax=Oryza brachyantha TaxID=4533 RepID=UPI001ADBAED0|nr:D-amino-acid transaminase, chloroplastic-like isoform X2 [Oryza brachyantha]
MGSYVQGEDEVPVYESGVEIVQKLQEKWKSAAAPPYPAMYSSVVGGIILDPAMMVVPIDDHMVHRGHGVFDTAMILDGNLYELDPHLDRFLRSAAKARIGTPFPRDTLRGILVQMTAASNCRRGSIRYWLSSGPGDFLLSSRGCPAPAFYAVVIPTDYAQCRHGVRAVTTSVPMKPPLFATMKNVNYLPNVLSIMDAEDRGAFASVWVDDEGYVAEGPMVNVAFVTAAGELVLPAFDKILTGCTAKRLLALAPRLVESGVLRGVSTRHIAAADARRSAEMAFVGSGLPLLPIVEWDGQPIGDGEVGKTMLALSDLLWEDMKSGPDRIAVPYK